MERYRFEFVGGGGGRPWAVFDVLRGHGDAYAPNGYAMAFCRDAATAEMIVTALNAQDTTRKERAA